MRIDFPRQGNQTEEEKKQNKDLSKKYKIEGFPTVIVLDAKGQILDQKVGYSKESAESYVKWLKSLKEKGKEKEKGTEKKEQP
jgi:protein disulfide-isomerase